VKASERYRAGYIALAERGANGAPEAGSTVVVEDPDRDGTFSASCYSLGDRSIVWCDAAVSARVRMLGVTNVLSATEFTEAATAAGAELLGHGHVRVLDGAPLHVPTGSEVVRVQHITAADEQPVGALQELISACDDDDLDAAELDLDELDPIYTLLYASGSVVAYASARPGELDPAFSDIAVLTHPQWRGRGLGVRAVRELIVGHTRPGRHWLYRCNVDNVGSNRVAESLGFTLVSTIGAVRFPADDLSERA
jgi:L-amino acid N-acyltransferase YncA